MSDVALDQIKKFRIKFTKIMKAAFFTSKEQDLHALVIRNCNGTGSWSFSDATIDYSLPLTFPASMFYFSGYNEIVKYMEECLEERTQTSSAGCLKREKMLKTLINRVLSDKHERCLNQLLEDKNLNEEKIKCILAIHYFKPLSYDGIYFVDKCQGYRTCPLCEEIVVVDQKQTTIGHPSVWHGQADIVVQKSLVKVDIEEDIGNLSIQDEEAPDILDCSNIVEVKTEDPKSSSQAIAQTIVNAFVESRMKQSLFDKFIPSFLATEKNIRIILYNCKMDKLLISDEFPIWDDNRTLSMRTLTFVWLTLNTFMNKLDKYAKHILDSTPESRFKEVVGETYSIYLNDVSRPMKKVAKDSSMKHHIYRNEDVEMICGLKMEVSKITQNLEEKSQKDS